jgi:hypothetical protein
MGPVMAFYQNAPRALRHLDQFDFDEKRLVLRALQAKVAVGRHGVKLTGAIPRDLATTGRTSACASSMHSITGALAGIPAQGHAGRFVLIVARPLGGTDHADPSGTHVLFRAV